MLDRIIEMNSRLPVYLFTFKKYDQKRVHTFTGTDFDFECYKEVHPFHTVVSKVRIEPSLKQQAVIDQRIRDRGDDIVFRVAIRFADIFKNAKVQLENSFDAITIPSSFSRLDKSYEPINMQTVRDVCISRR